MKTLSLFLITFLMIPISYAQNIDEIYEIVDHLTEANAEKVIDWRRDFHQNPELSNMEFRTAARVAEHLIALGIEVRTNVAVTGVVGVLETGRPGPVVALRADMDALPVTEALDLPFASKVTTEYNGKETGVMHACGHDAHTAILMGVAEVLASMKDQLKGSVKFIFQPAEEGAFGAESWGAELMIEEGALGKPVPDVIFGLHTWPEETGTILYKTGALMASVDNFEILVKGRSTHGAAPWDGVDPVVAAAQTVLGLQSIVSRNAELPEGAVVVTVGSIQGGNRNNIIPDEVKLLGTLRTHNEKSRKLAHYRIKEVAENIAKSAGAEAEVTFDYLYPSTVNNEAIVQKMIPVLEKVVGPEKLLTIPAVMMAEDMSYFLNEVAGMYFFLGIVPPGTPAEEVESNHSSRFFVDEDALLIGTRALSYMTVTSLLEDENKK